MNNTNRKSNLKMAGRGSLKKTEETIKTDSDSYWKSHGSGGSSLLDHSEKKDHMKEYSLGDKSQLKKSDSGLRKKTGLRSSGSRYVARMR